MYLFKHTQDVIISEVTELNREDVQLKPLLTGHIFPKDSMLR